MSRAVPRCFRCLLAGVQPLKYSVFSPLLIADLGVSADPAPSTPIFKFTLLGMLQIPKPCFAPPSLAGVAVLGEKLRSPLPVVVSKSFQCYCRRAKKLREGQSLKWNEVLLSDSLEAAKMFVGYADNMVTVAEQPAEKVAKPPTMKKTETLMNQGIFRKGFLNLPPIVSVPPTLFQEVNNGGLVGPSSPPSDCLNGFSQSRNWPVGFDHNEKLWCGRRKKMIIGMDCP